MSYLIDHAMDVADVERLLAYHIVPLFIRKQKVTNWLRDCEISCLRGVSEIPNYCLTQFFPEIMWKAWVEHAKCLKQVKVGGYPSFEHTHTM